MKKKRSEMRVSTIKTYMSLVNESILQSKLKYTLGKLKKRNWNFGEGEGVLKRIKVNLWQLLIKYFAGHKMMCFLFLFRNLLTLTSTSIAGLFIYPRNENLSQLYDYQLPGIRKYDVRSLKESYWKCETHVRWEK